MACDFSYGFDEATAEWWVNKRATLKWGDAQWQSEYLFFADTMDTMVQMCMFLKYKYDEPSIHLYSNLVINNISSLFDETEDLYFYMFLQWHGCEIVNFLANNSQLPKKYLMSTVMEYSDTNKYFPLTTFKELTEWKPCVVSSDIEMKAWCVKVIQENSKIVNDYRAGKLAALNSLKGRVMKLSNGTANMTMVESILKLEIGP